MDRATDRTEHGHVRLASLDTIPEPAGTYFEQEKPNGRQGKQATDTQLSADLWDHSATLLGLPAAL